MTLVERLKMFDFFKKNHINCVFFGEYDDFCRINYEKERKVVIYSNFDDKSSENIELCRFGDINDWQKCQFMSEFVETEKTIYSNFKSRSSHIFYMPHFSYTYNEYSVNDWRSNEGTSYVNKQCYFVDLPKWYSGGILKIKCVGPDRDLKAFKIEEYK